MDVDDMAHALILRDLAYWSGRAEKLQREFDEKAEGTNSYELALVLQGHRRRIADLRSRLPKLQAIAGNPEIPEGQRSTATLRVVR